MPNEDQALNEIDAPAPKTLTELMGELKALEDNAHNLADAQTAIRTKERDIIKAFAAAHDELLELFAGANIEPIVEAVKARFAQDNAKAMDEIDAHIGEVVEQANKNMDAAKVDVAAAVGEIKTSVEATHLEVLEQGKVILDLQARLGAIAEHPALSIPPLEPAAAPAPAGEAAAETKTDTSAQS